MSEDKVLEAKRKAFFERAHKAIESKQPSTFSETELEELWPGPGGRFDINEAGAAFEREGIHWEWLNLPPR